LAVLNQGIEISGLCHHENSRPQAKARLTVFSVRVESSVNKTKVIITPFHGLRVVGRRFLSRTENLVFLSVREARVQSQKHMSARNQLQRHQMLLVQVADLQCREGVTAPQIWKDQVAFSLLKSFPGLEPTLQHQIQILPAHNIEHPPYMIWV